MSRSIDYSSTSLKATHATAAMRSSAQGWRRAAIMLLVLMLTGVALPRSSNALDVEEVVTNGGIRAWLARVPGSPLMAIHFAFMGGTTQDPVGKEGVAVLLASLIGDGAGSLDRAAYRAAVGRAGLRLDFTAARDAILGTAEFHTNSKAEALELLRLALLEPRLDAADIDRVRHRLSAENADAERNQRAIAHRRWHEQAFEGHSYARPAEGSVGSLARIGRDDLVEYRRQLLSLGALRLVAVGDIDATQLGTLLDSVFATLPVEIAMVPPRTVVPRTNRALLTVTGDFTQSLAVIGMPFLPPHDPAFPAALVLQRILGGDQLEARLLAELRVKRRLAYSASIDLAGDAFTSLLKGEVVTAPDRMNEAVEATLAVLSGLADAGPTEDEVENAKSYLIGSFPLSFDSSGQIAANLLSLRMAGHAPDYVTRRATALASVTREDVRRVARQWLEPAAVSVVVVGPER